MSPVSKSFSFLIQNKLPAAIHKRCWIPLQEAGDPTIVAPTEPPTLLSPQIGLLLIPGDTKLYQHHENATGG